MTDRYQAKAREMMREFYRIRPECDELESFFAQALAEAAAEEREACAALVDDMERSKWVSFGAGPLRFPDLPSLAAAIRARGKTEA